MLRTVALVLLAACGRVGFGEGQLVGSDGSVADGPSDARVCSGPDEDSDGVPDACDVCPHLPALDEPDADADGVGDRCDPEPAMPRQRIAFFDGFTEVRPEWSTSGTMTGGQLVLDFATSGGSATLSVPAIYGAMQVGGSITALGAPIQQLFLGVSPAENDLYYVELIDETGSGRRRSLMRGFDNMFTEYEGIRETAPIMTGPVTLALGCAAGRLDGRIDTLGAAPAPLDAPCPVFDLVKARVVYVEHVSLTLDYAIVVETVP